MQTWGEVILGPRQARLNGAMVAMPPQPGTFRHAPRSAGADAQQGLLELG